ncbi:adenylosuccinate lyase [Patescibacteria group bacterium]|nr:adenylosuccinate lyase [Patescibacteria group bacterium]
MNKRYSRKKMVNLWSDKTKFFNWLKVEFTVMQARIEREEIKAKIPKDLLRKIIINPDEIHRIEKEVTKHDVIAFLMQVSPQLPEKLQSWFHNKMTSYDPQDTGLGITLVESTKIIIDDVKQVMVVMRRIALEHKYIPMIGRTHGVHAEPITFGVKVANWYDEMNRHLLRLKRLKKAVAFGKLSGAVGMYTLDPEIEEIVCAKLRLKPTIATQIISRDIVSEYVAVMAIIAGTIGKICTTLRGLARTEIREVMEYFDPNQRGSSAMPHKKNPISWENISGICRDIGSRFMTAFQNQITWDERDLANSGSERLILPEVSVYTDYILARFTTSLDKMIIFPDQMKKNLEITKGLIFSQDVQSLLARKSGLPREQAYEIIRQEALKCWQSNFSFDFYTMLKKNRTIIEYVSEKELGECFSLKKKLQHVDYIFKKVFKD